MKVKDVLGLLSGLAIFGGFIAVLWYAKEGAQWAKYGCFAYGVLFTVMIVRSIIITRRRWGTGTEVARFYMHPQGDEWVCEGKFVLRDLRDEKLQWCRIAAQVRVLREGYEQEWRRRFGEWSEIPRNKYSFRLADRYGVVLYEEQGDLCDQYSYLAHKPASYGLHKPGRSSLDSYGKFALLEFLPPRPGEYEFSYRVVKLDERAGRVYRFRDEVLNVEIFVTQGVFVFKEPGYRHKKLDFLHEGAVRKV